MNSYPFDDSWSSLIAKIDFVSGRLVLFTKVKDGSLVFSGTDGINLWQVEMDENDLKQKVNASGMASVEEFLTQIRISMENSVVQVSTLPQTLTVVFGERPSIITIELYETTAQNKKEELKEFIFSLVDTVKDLEIKLKGVNDKLKNVEDSSKAAVLSTSPFKDQSLKRPKTISRPKQSKGHSVINPGSKRKTEAKGVVFE